MPVRVPGSLNKTTIINPPMSPDIDLTIRSATTRDVLARQNLFDKVRYIQQDGDGTTVTERSFPMGDLQIETVLLVLVDWNLSNEAGAKYPITKKNVLDLLAPDEFRFCYEQIIAQNVVWGGAEGEE